MRKLTKQEKIALLSKGNKSGTTKQLYNGMLTASWGEEFASAVVEFAIANGQVKSANVEQREINIVCKNGVCLNMRLVVE